MKNEVLQVRTITHNGNVYIRMEDVTRLIIEFGSTEETDVRNRSEILALNVNSMIPKK